MYCRDIIPQKRRISRIGKEIDVLHLNMQYYITSYAHNQDIYLYKQDEKIYIIKSSFESNDIKNIMSKIDFKKVYDCCVENFKGKSLDVVYDFGNNHFDTYIKLDYDNLIMGDFNFSYIMKLNKLYKKDTKENDSYIIKQSFLKAQEIYVNDDDFLDHLMVKFKDLPNYVQENWETYAYNKDNKENKIKKFLKRLRNN